MNSHTDKGIFDPSAWEVVDSRSLGIKKESVLYPAIVVLKTLQSNGYVTCLVGGCVRDLILKRTPKDFDVITTATLKQVKRLFRHCIIIGRRFPICQVHISGNIIEVSSFDTISKNGDKQEETISPQIPNNSADIDFVCWRNCMKRDFTINCLFFDPLKFRIYDFVGGLKDLRASKVRTVIPPHLAFKEDCGKILRGIRIAARLGLQFSKETETAIQDLSSSILTLDKARLLLEMNFMMAHGAAASSINLLGKFKMLELLLPAHAVYLASQKNVQRPNMLMKLLMNADKLLGADRPCNSNLWLGLLAFHLALVDNPQDPLVVYTFSSVMYYGKWHEALAFAKRSSHDLIRFVPEILPPSKAKSDELLLEETSRFASLVKYSVEILTGLEDLQESSDMYSTELSSTDLEDLQQSPDIYSTELSPRLVFASTKLGKNVCLLFDVIESCIICRCIEDENLHAKEKSEGDKVHFNDINYEFLKKGDLRETTVVLGRIIMASMRREPIGKVNERTKGKKTAKLSSLF